MKDIFIENKLPYYNEEIKKEHKGMKGSDKVMVEITGYQVAKLYALLGVSNGEMKYSDGLFGVFRNILGQEALDLHHFLKDKQFPAIIHFIDIERELYKAVLEPETPVLTEAQKKALEIKETIAKAQKQLEELEKEIE